MPIEAGYINGGFSARGPDDPRGPVLVVDVADIDAALQRVAWLALTREHVWLDPAGSPRGLPTYFERSEFERGARKAISAPHRRPPTPPATSPPCTPSGSRAS